MLYIGHVGNKVTIGLHRVNLLFRSTMFFPILYDKMIYIIYVCYVLSTVDHGDIDDVSVDSLTPPPSNVKATALFSSGANEDGLSNDIGWWCLVITG